MKIFKTFLVLAIVIISNNLFAQLTVNENHTDCHCVINNGSIDVTVTGGSGTYTYDWSTVNGSGLINGQEDQSGLTEGTYNLSVDDGTNTETVSIIINQKPIPNIAVNSQTDVTCYGSNDGCASVFVTGGEPPYAYDWIPYGGTNSDTSSCMLGAGMYSVISNDADGCESSISFEINEPSFTLNINDSVNASNGVCNGSIDIIVIDGTAPFLFNWNTGDTTEDLSGLCAGFYSVTVSDSNNCQINNSYIIENEYDSTITSFVDTISVVIDTCLFNTSVPIDSANIYDFEIISIDSAITNWVFWQAGSAIYLDVVVSYTPGLNLIYLEIICLNKATNIYKFYGIFNSESVNVSKVEKIINVEVYPNPVKDFVNIIVNNNELSRISIIDISGKILKTEKFNSIIKIETKDFEKGIYIFRIETDDEVVTGKLLID